MRKKIMELVNEYFAMGGEMQQNIDEMLKAIEYLGDRKFDNFVELGSAYGGSLWIYSNTLCTKNANIIAVDSRHDPSLVYTVNKLKELGKNIKFIIESTNATRNAINQVKFDIDLLHIDANHSYESTKKDYEMWGAKVKKGGVILFHDAVLHTGVKQFMKELGNKVHIIESESKMKLGSQGIPTTKCGIGVLIK